MRILHVIPSLDPANGGPPKIALRLAAAQAGLGHQVRMLAYGVPGTESSIEDELRAIPFAERTTVEFLHPINRVESLTAYRASRAVHSRLAEGVDFVHLHSLWSTITKATASAARRAGVPYTLLVNGMLDPWSLSQRKLKKRIALELGYKRMLNGCAFLHLGNRDEHRLIEPLGLRCPVEIIPNGIFADELSPLPEPGTFRRGHPELGESPFVLFLARLHYKKGLDYLADAFAFVATQLPDVRLVIAGPDDGERRPFEERIARTSVARRVHIVGPIYGAEKLAALSDAACFCLPSRQEGFSVAITEALGCGVPVVISDACHFPEVAAVGAGFVTPLNASATAEALLQVLRHPSARETFGAAGRTLVHERFTWPRIAQQTLEAYKAHLSKKSSSARHVA